MFLLYLLSTVTSKVETCFIFKVHGIFPLVPERGPDRNESPGVSLLQKCD